MVASKKELLLIRAALDMIRKELDRLYLDKYQREMVSPFDDTGASYMNKTFSVSAFYHGNEWELSATPNFWYKDLCVYWYKHSNCDVYAHADEPLTSEYLATMIDDCFKAMREDFKYDGE